jgi:hypothetical protein
MRAHDARIEHVPAASGTFLDLETPLGELLFVTVFRTGFRHGKWGG